MATLTIKKLPDDVYARIKASAGSNRRSINAEAIVRLERSFTIYAESTIDSESPTRGRVSEPEAAYSLDATDPIRSEKIDELLQEARRWSRADADDTMSDALRAYIARMKRLSLLDIAGRIDYDPDYDYKRARRAR